MAKVHRTNNNIVKHIRSVTIPYKDIMEVLEKDGEAFLEANEENPLRRQTVWKAAKRLSDLMGRRVRYDRALLKVDGVEVLSGYSFSLEEDPRSQTPQGTAS